MHPGLTLSENKPSERSVHAFQLIQEPHRHHGKSHGADQERDHQEDDTILDGVGKQNRQSQNGEQRTSQLEDDGGARDQIGAEPDEQGYLENRHLNVPASYTSKNGLKIGSWIRRQRQKYYGLGNGAHLTDAQIERLNALGMIWDDAYVTKWEKGYSCALAYYETFGNLNVPTTYVDATGFALGRWVKRHKQRRTDGRPAIRITPDRRAKLDAIGMVWE